MIRSEGASNGQHDKPNAACGTLGWLAVGFVAGLILPVVVLFVGGMVVQLF